MCNSWISALGMYNWVVDLRHFRNAGNYPGYFNRIIQPPEVIQFEDTFRAIINENGSFEITGEVCFWKNYGSAQARDRVTQNLLNHVSEQANWNIFIQAIREISNDPCFANFISLRNACNQSRGFATPITFLAFYKPTDYPMVDKHIANWWRAHKTEYGYGEAPEFSQRNDGWIQTYTADQNELNWNAYIAWKRFCCDYSERIQRNCGLNWRARDVEIAVWMAQQNGLFLTALQ